MIRLSDYRRQIILAFFFFAGLLSYTWENQFPYFYHSDEESKALQILYGYRNYWHPMLMLNATNVLSRLVGMDGDAQSLTMVGRYLAAFFSSIGVVSFVAFAWSRKGVLIAVLTGCLLLVMPLLFEISHYCKEDAGLLMGLGLTLLVLERFRHSPELKNVILLGVVTGLATSAKYPGVLLILGVLPVVWLRRRAVAPLMIFLLSAILIVLAINWQWLVHFPDVIAGIQRESIMLAGGHDGVARTFPHAEYWSILLYEHGWPMLIFALVGMMATQRKGEVFAMEFILGSLILIIMILLSYSAKVSDRYLLPVFAITLYLAACGIQLAGKWIPARFRTAGYAALIAVAAFQPVFLLGSWIKDFRNDSRADLATWLHDHIPTSDLVATSLWTRLPGFYRGQFISGQAPADYVADLGSLEDLRKMNYRWVVVADVERQRFDNPLQTGNANAQIAFLHRRTFYQELEKRADLRWMRPPSVVYSLHPGLRLYELRPDR